MESVTLEWTYNTEGDAFRQAEFATQGVPFIEGQFLQEPVAINPTYFGRGTATFLAVNRSDSRSYHFIVHNANRLTDDRALDIEVHCEWG